MAARLFDIAPQLWQYLDEYDRVAFRSISRDGRRAHDCLLEHLCIHDLWGRQSEAWPAEMESGIRDMLHRGCRPCALMLRFQGPASEQEHLARGWVLGSQLQFTARAAWKVAWNYPAAKRTSVHTKPVHEHSCT